MFSAKSSKCSVTNRWLTLIQSGPVQFTEAGTSTVLIGVG